MDHFATFEEISLDGFQIVKSEMFVQMARRSDPTCTIWPTRLSFSKLSLTKLNNCEYVRIEVNPKTKSLIVIPVSSSDKNSIRWLTGQKECTTRKLESRQFGADIYRVWKLDREYNYRARGRLVSSKDNKVMLLFDFKNAEAWKTKQLEK